MLVGDFLLGLVLVVGGVVGGGVGGVLSMGGWGCVVGNPSLCLSLSRMYVQYLMCIWLFLSSSVVE